MAYDNIHLLSDPDDSAIRAHLDRLFRRVPEEYPGGMMEIAWAEPTGAVKHAEWFPCTPQGIAAAASTASVKNREHRNVYVGVNPRRPDAMPGGRASAEDVEIAFFQFAECDKLESIELLRRAPIPYSFAVTTGRTPHRRPHAYWEVEDPIRNMAAWSAQQAGLRDYFKGDAVIDPPRIMRLAGTINYPPAHKQERGYRTELVTIRTIYDDEERPPTTSEDLASVYRWGQLSVQRPLHQEAVTEFSSAEATGLQLGPSGLSIKGLIGNIHSGQEWHNNTLRLVAHMVNRGDPDALILALAPALTLPGWTAQQTHIDLSRMLTSARVKWNIPNREEDFSASPTISSALPLIWCSDVTPNLDASDFVEGLLSEGQMSVIYGESNCGKTFFMTDLAFHVAIERTWRDRAVEKGGIIYVALEGGFGIKNRIAALKQHYGIDDAPLAIVPSSINLLDPDADTSRVIDLIKEASETVNLPIKLVVIDTLSRALSGGNENAPEDMGRLVINADRIRQETKAHLSFVHHSGKDQSRGARGHSLLRAATDTEIEIIKDEDTGISTATVEKQRELEISGRFAFQLKPIELGVNRRGKVVSSCIVQTTDAAPEQVKRVHLTDDEAGAYRELKELFNRSEQTVMVVPENGMPTLRCASRDTIRNWFVKRGVIGVANDVALNATDRSKLNRILNGLKNKDKIMISGNWVWLL